MMRNHRQVCLWNTYAIGDKKYTQENTNVQLESYGQGHMVIYLGVTWKGLLSQPPGCHICSLYLK